jgi:anti-anti-sigma regulatory factor
MASNFHMFSFKTRGSLHLKLEGDFDGNSAYELLETLKKYNNGSYQIFIDMNDLKTIYPFGKQVFQKKLGICKQQISNLIFIGENGQKISPN